MFTKPDRAGHTPHSFDASYRPDTPRKSASGVPSLISSDIRIKGDLAGEGELHVDGEIIGDVSVKRLVVGESGSVQGAISAQSVEVRGQVTGSISAQQVRLHATAKLDGDVAHEQLTMDAGAQFLGRSMRYAAPSPALIASGEVIEMTAAE
jgi:cytoskeletal protein CcmA (bactofilin family)